MAQPRVVSIHYTLTNDQGEELDSSRVEGREPLSYLEGAQNIVGGLESALNEKAVGDAMKVSVAPAEGYGRKERRAGSAGSSQRIRRHRVHRTGYAVPSRDA